MKLIHFSDTHLGFNDLDIINNDGINQREVDFYDAFTHVIDAIIDKKPDYAIHTGNLFHRIHSSNRAISFCLTQLKRLSVAEVKTVIIAGNHFKSRTKTASPILDALHTLDYIYPVFEEAYEKIEFNDISFHCIPHIDDEDANLEAKENDRDDYEKLKAIMSEFKTHINARVTPRIGEVSSEMYSRITRGKYQHIEVSPEFDFYIYDNGERYPIERFSGGEIDLANLVLRIAISKTLGELSGGGNIGFLAFDEVFGSQDEERRIQIMEAFHTISESYRQIFLISHETEIKEMFERVVEL